MDATTASIFIRVRNEARDLPRCLREIARQRVDGCTVDVTVLDCESTDGSADIARDAGATVYSIPPRLFTYSKALMFGALNARGDFFIPLSGHVIPSNDQWLAALLHPLRSDTRVSAAFSRQTIPLAASAMERRENLRVFPENSFRLSKEEVGNEKLPASLYDRLVFSNASACYRTSILRKYPFRELPFSEDRFWAGEALLRGELIAYASDSVCEHYHYPDFAAFRSVARRATVSRCLIEKLLAPQFGMRFASPGILQEFFAYARIPIAVSALAFLVGLSPLIGNRLSLSFLIASIGTTIGKAEGLSNFRSLSLDDVPFANPESLIREALL